MARTRPCRYCDKPVAPNARRCPSCDGKRPYPPPSSWPAVIILGIIVAAVALLYADEPSSRSASTRTSPTTSGPSARPTAGVDIPHPVNPFAVGTLRYEEARAHRGHDLFRAIMAEYTSLDPFYHSVDTRDVSRGFAAHMSIPDEAWLALDAQEQIDLGHFMCRISPINGWSIAVGSIAGVDILSDRIALSSKDWPFVEPETAPRQPGCAVTWDDALAACRDLVRDSLRSPRSAKFPSFFDRSETSVIETEPCRFRIDSWVEADNAFGANVRTPFVADLELVRGQWVLHALELGK